MASKTSPYTDSLGRYRTKSLFIETILPEQVKKGMKPMYTLKGHPDYTDLRKRFLDLEDPTGYELAIEAFDSWAHLQHLKSLAWFRKIWDEWCAELEVKLTAGAIRNLIKQSKDSKGTTAAKYIAEKGWQKKRGRPSKEEIAAERKHQARVEDELAEDFNRIGLH